MQDVAQKGTEKHMDGKGIEDKREMMMMDREKRKT